MNEQPTFNGHRVEGCTGSWIDITSLSSRGHICSECRARIHSLEVLESTPQPPPEAPIGLANLGARTLWLLVGLAAALAIPAIIALVLSLRRL